MDRSIAYDYRCVLVYKPCLPGRIALGRSYVYKKFIFYRKDRPVGSGRGGGGGCRRLMGL